MTNKMNKVFSKTNINFEFLIKKDSIFSRKFVFENTCFKHAAIKRNDNTSFINNLFIF